MKYTLIVKSNPLLSNAFCAKYISNKSLVYIEKSGDIKFFQYHLNKQFKNIIVTSKNALLAIDVSEFDIDVNFFTVGKTSESLLKDKNFYNIKRYKNVEEMVDELDKNLQYLYLRGEDIACNLANILPNLTEAVVYKVDYEQNLSNECLRLVKGAMVERIFLFSYNTTKHFLHLLEKENTLHFLKDAVFYSMSLKAGVLLQEKGLKYEIIEYDH